jgi:acyl carrier protein
MTAAIDAIKQTLEKVKSVRGLAGELADNADIINSVGLDSLEMLQFMLDLEERLSIRIDFDRLEYSYFNSISTLAEFMETMPSQ